MRLSLSIISEATLIRSHQHDCLDMNSKRTMKDILKWIGKSSRDLHKRLQAEMLRFGLKVFYREEHTV